MGKPAARLGDMTAHGGSIVGPGCPTVLIGGMPAARIGDMHVCPMMNPGLPPPPHVGGPISLGSTGVFIGGMPAVPVTGGVSLIGVDMCSTHSHYRFPQILSETCRVAAITRADGRPRCC